MARDGRRDPGKIVGYVEDEKSKVKTEIRLITDRMMFYARVGEATTENKDGDVVRKWVADQMRAMRNVEWTPIIIVEYSSTRKPGQPHLNGREIEEAITGEINVTARRSYVAKLGNALRELDWQDHAKVKDPTARVDESYRIVYPAEVLTRLPYRPRVDSWSNVEIVFPYDEQLWAGLVAIIGSIERSRAALKKILAVAGPAGEFLRHVGSGSVPIGALVAGPDESPADVVDEEDDE